MTVPTRACRYRTSPRLRRITALVAVIVIWSQTPSTATCTACWINIVWWTLRFGGGGGCGGTGGTGGIVFDHNVIGFSNTFSSVPASGWVSLCRWYRCACGLTYCPDHAEHCHLKPAVPSTTSPLP